jgi:hypothetical protein
MAVKIKRLMVPTHPDLSKLPQWAQKIICDQERELRSLTDLLEELRTGQEETPFSYLDVRQPKMKRETPFYLPKHVLQVTALANSPSPIDMRVLREDSRSVVSISTSGLATALQVLPRAANMIYVTGVNR